MTRSILWRIAAGAYVFINAAGAIWAAAEEEEMHMMLHIFLLLLGFAAYLGWRLALRGRPLENPQQQLGDQRLEYLQQSVDALALELERVGEAQRFHDRLRAERELPPMKRD